MFNNFYLNENTFSEINIKKVENNVKYFIGKWRKDGFVINLDKDEFKKIYNKLKATSVNQKVLSQILDFCKSYRGTKILNYNKNISDYMIFRIY